jgi:succinylglutamate desuccinylase
MSVSWIPLNQIFEDISVEFLVGNPKALECQQRFLKRNLNRLLDLETLCDDETAKREQFEYELQRARILAESIRESDVLLDVHSCSSDSPPFALPSSTDVSEELAASLPVQYVVESLVHQTAGGGTTLDWALACDIPGVCVECGRHDHPDAVARAVAAISSFLLLEAGKLSRQDYHTKSPTIMRCQGVEIVHEHFEWVREFTEFEFIPNGEAVFRDDVRGLTCCNIPGGAYLVMPNQLPVLGEEALFWGVPVEVPSD